MTEPPRTYRTPWVIVPILGGVVALGAARLLFKAASEDLGATGETIIVVSAIVFAGLLAAAVLRARTTVDHEGIVVRSVFSATRFRWADIVELRIEQSDQSGMNRASFPNVCLYDQRLRRILLPNVSDKRVGGTDALVAELARLRQLWEDGRGPNWRPRDEELAHRDRRSARTIPVLALFVIAVGIGMVSMVLTLIISLAILQAPQQSDTTFGQVFGAPFIFGVPAMLAVAAFVIGLVWRHKRIAGA